MFMTDTLARIVGAERLTAVVDIGANPLDSDGMPPYKPMLDRRLCTLVGFEPQGDALAQLNSKKSDLETYLPYAVGSGAPGTLKVCAARGMTSLLDPDPAMLAIFPGFVDYGRVIGTFPVETRTLDSIAEISALDFLKIDVQGEELTVFQHGAAKLAQAVAIQAEVSFMPLYKDQPVYGDIDLALRGMGFIPHMFVHINKRMILPLHDPNQPYLALNQLLEADVVYVRDFTRMDDIGTEQLKHLAMVAHHCYASYDLVVRCLHAIVARGAAPTDAVTQYMASLRAAAA